MPVVRIYLPLGRDDLVELDRSRELSATTHPPRPAFRVSPELERAQPGLDVEALEYAAFCEAVSAAVVSSATEGGLVVVAADVDPTWLVDIETDSAIGTGCRVGLAQTLPITRIASFHVGDDEPDGLDDEFEAGDLLWYDVTELQEVLGLFGTATS